ncbi:MAG TPA: hypothetical protein VGT60_04665 [Candidatus Limnocylindria bacterium]|nr:hypothetical protein [Candidatus Limnocylindria bacterium]
MKPKTTDLQIRGIPVATRDKLRRKARSSGVSMSKYLIDLIDRDVPTVLPLAEWLAMVRKNPRIDLGRPAADLLHEAQDEDDARWDEYFASRNEPPPDRP